MFSHAWEWFWRGTGTEEWTDRHEVVTRLDAVEEAVIAERENRLTGDRVWYDVGTGVSENVDGWHCAPEKLDAHGRQVRL
jgi:hypothetical protein